MTYLPHKSERIPVIFCLDAEPDPRRTVPGQPIAWSGFERGVPFFKMFRKRLERLSGEAARFSWYFRLDPQIEDTYGDAGWPLEHYASAVDSFLEAGDELGVHPHAFRWNVVRREWTGDYGDPAWVNHCTRMCFEAFEDRFGTAPRIIRFGDRWVSSAALKFAESLGAQIDLTPEPGYPYQPASIMMKLAGETFTDGLPDCRRVPHAPYRPSEKDFQAHDPLKEEGLWIIPLTTGFITPKAGKLERLRRSLFQPAYLKPWNATLNVNQRPDHFRAILYQWLETADYLAPVMRSDIFVLKQQMENFKQNVETLLSHPLAKRFVFTTPHTALEMLNGAVPEEALAEGLVL